MLTDPIADMLTRIRNAHLALHKEVNVPRSKMKEALAAILKQEGYVEDVAIDDRNITITLKYQKGKAVISGLKRVSTPGRRVYVGAHQIPKVQNGLGICILSTSSGVLDGMTARNARWYYLSSLANQGLGNSIDALQDARRAVQLDPNNTEYRMHLQRLQNPGRTYRTQTTYAQPGGIMRWCWSMILLNLLCNCCCGGWGFYGPRYGFRG
mgnify:CR=1 FL=1